MTKVTSSSRTKLVFKQLPPQCELERTGHFATYPPETVTKLTTDYNNWTTDEEIVLDSWEQVIMQAVNNKHPHRVQVNLDSEICP